MILEEFIGKDSENKNRVFVEIQCDNCSTRYIRQKRFLKETHGCSPKCLSILKGKRLYIDCAHCGSSVEKKVSALNNSKSGLYFCDRKCKEAGQSYIKEIMPGHYGTGGSYRTRALREFGSSCQRCSYNANIAAIVVHHKDRNRDNNELENLEVLCANCHAIEHWGT